MLMEFNVSLALWQSYLNAILESLQGRKNYFEIMDDSLIHITGISHEDRLHELLTALLKNGLKIPYRNVSYLEEICNTWEMHFYGKGKSA